MSGTFIKSRHGKIRLNTPKELKPNRIPNTSIDPKRIIGIDSETIHRGKNIHTKFLQLYVSEFENWCFDCEQHDALFTLFEYLLNNYGETYDHANTIAQRSRSQRKTRGSDRSGRDGRREKLTPVLLTYFNLQYDMGRLLDPHPTFRRFVGTGQDSLYVDCGNYQVEIVYSVIDGGSPSFNWILKDPSKKIAVNVHGFDGSNYFLCSLADAAKSLDSMGVSQKLDVDKDLFTRDWDKDKPTQWELKDFETYATQDAKIHKEIYIALVDILTQIDPYVLNRKGMIGMSMGSSAWRMIVNKMSVDKYVPPAPHFQEMGLNAYYGAISFCLKPGKHENITIDDISSAYPDVESRLPAFETVRRVVINPAKVDMSFKKYEWGIVRISGESLDAYHPPLVTELDNRQIGIFGPFSEHWCTISEVKIGIARGALRVDKFHYGYELLGPVDGGLSRFIKHMYHIKNTSEKNSPIYNMAKGLMNIPYGKMIERRKLSIRIPNVIDGQSTIVYNIKDETFRKKCKELYVNEGYIAVREAHEEYLVDHDLRTAEKCPDEISLENWISIGESYDSGTYFLADYAACITGYTRAKLMAAASITHSIQGDTDSIFFTGEIPDDFYEKMEKWGIYCPRTGLGSFDIEKENVTLISVKKKNYTAIDKDGKIVKQAKHTMHKAKYVESDDMTPSEKSQSHKENFLHMQLHMLEEGTLTYETKEKPLKMKEAWSTNRTCGLFMSRMMTLMMSRSPYHEIDENGMYRWLPFEEITKHAKADKNTRETTKTV